MEAMVENAAAPASRFYCHSCAIEIDRVSSEFTCPHCREGFIEELPAAERSSASGQVPGPGSEQPSTDYGQPPISNEAIRLAGEIFTNSVLSAYFGRPGGWDGAAAPGPANGEQETLTLDDIVMYGMPIPPGVPVSTVPGVGAAPAGNDSGEAAAGSSSGSSGAGAAGGDGRPSVRYPGRRGSRRRGVQHINQVDHILREILISVSGGANGAGAGGQMLFMGNPGDYAWGREGIDMIVTQLLNQMDNTGPPPLDKDRIAEIPTVTINDEQVERKLQCSVCFEDFVVDEAVRKLPCLHVYHEPCIIPWLELHGTCPICRKSLTPEGGMHGAAGPPPQGPDTHQQQAPGETSQQNPHQQTASSQADGGRQNPNILTFRIRPAMTNLLFEMGHELNAAATATNAPGASSSLPPPAAGSGTGSPPNPAATTSASAVRRPAAERITASTQTSNSERDDDGTIDYTLDLD